MSDDRIGIIFIFSQKIVGAGESDLIDIFVDFLGSQSQTMVGNGNGFLVYLHLNGQVTEFAFKLSFGSQRLQFLGSVYRI